MKQYKYLIIVMILIFGINLVSALDLGAGNKTSYVNCSQEYANISTSCGGVNTGNYLVTGSIWSGFPISNMYDGDYTSWVETSCSATGSLFINYSRPLNSTNLTGSTWRIKIVSTAYGIQDLNYTIPNSCLINNTNLQLNLTNVLGCTAKNTTLNLSCYDGSNYNYFYNTFFNYSGGAVELHEEAINWNISYFLNNLQENSQSFNGNTSISSTETFSINITYDNSGFSGITATFNYNNTNYSTSSSGSGGNLVFSKSLQVPTVASNNTFYWWIGLTNSTGTYYYNSTYHNQTVNPTSFSYCSGSRPYINFTTIDENIFNELNATFKVTFNYFSPNSTSYLNYSYQDLTMTKSRFGFCLLPSNTNISVNAEIEYSATNYNSKTYYLSNALLTNQTTMINLTLSNSSLTQIFYMTVSNGVSFVPDALVTIEKYYTGLGIWSTIGIRQTDSKGKFIEYLELNGKYRFTVILNNALLGVQENDAICSSAPCEILINTGSGFGDLYSSYNDIYAGNILSNISFNPTTKIVTYTFIDTTGLANYFKINVYKSILNNSNNLICTQTIYSTAGTLTCNMNGSTGDFIVRTYISRSPEKLDKILAFIIGDLIKDNLGVMRYLICMMVLVTVSIVGAVISRGNPSVVLIMAILSIDLLKFINFLPFSYVVVILINFLGIWMVSRLKT